jgi:predicted DsbA family dithiol-disulfide isomerase
MKFIGAIVLTQQNSDKKNSGENSPASPSQKNGALFGKSTMVAIIGIVVILIVFLVIMLSPSGNSASVPIQPCAEKVIGYANENLVQPGTSVTFKSVAESRGMYEIHGTYQSQDVTIYTTKDCTMLFTSGINMSASGNTAPQKPTPAPTPVKTARPSVDLYVMAFCPYGTQAESAMKPVVSLLGSKADIQVRYITTVGGSTVDSVQSLHGSSEAQEDLRQICIQKKYPEKFWDYIDAFNARCYPVSQNLTSLNACWRNTTASLGIDTSAIETCATGSDGLGMLKTDETNANQNGATASPTLLINGVKYSGARTPEAYKQAICNSFDTAPAECGTTLTSTQTAASAGGCG